MVRRVGPYAPPRWGLCELVTGEVACSPYGSLLIPSGTRSVMTPRPIEVEARPQCRIWIRYSDGAEGEVDLSHLAGRGVFALWDAPEEFEKVHIGPGKAISWSDQVELCPDSVYMWLTGRSPEELFPRLHALKHSA